MSGEKTVYQPLEPSMRARLDPEYVELHDTVLQYVPRSESQAWDPASRHKAGPMAMGAMADVRVGRVFDREDLGRFQARVFVPEGAAPENGWPLLVYFHGGGWVVGGLDSENGFLRHICKYLGCTVISINYRHAPEHVYPAAINDSYEGYCWAVSDDNAQALHLDVSRVAVGGLSAGGGLAAIVAMKAGTDAAVRQRAPVFQLLVCPVIDNTATVATGWATSQHAPWLTPTRMQWYRDKYFVGSSAVAVAAQTQSWDASPNFAPAAVLAASPATFLGVADCDLLAPEALRFGAQLRAADVAVNLQVYRGATHSILILAGIHKIGKKLVHDACSAYAKVLGIDYDPETAPICQIERRHR